MSDKLSIFIDIATFFLEMSATPCSLRGHLRSHLKPVYMHLKNLSQFGCGGAQILTMARSGLDLHHHTLVQLTDEWAIEICHFLSFSALPSFILFFIRFIFQSIYRVTLALEAVLCRIPNIQLKTFLTRAIQSIKRPRQTKAKHTFLD